ncbi:MAG: RES family NAD+ phosphorylase [Candidatus Acidiferrales bacterium]
MSVRTFRIVKQYLAQRAFDGEGARLYGGRWNSPGVAIVYTAESRSLAALELLVHLESAEALQSYVLFEVRIEPLLIQTLDVRGLLGGWRAEPPMKEVQAIGDRWVAAGESAVLKVPSAVIPEENNFLLNPAHADFGEIRIGGAQPFRLDPRVARQG